MSMPFPYQGPFVKADFNDRRLFGDLLNSKGLTGHAVEIGTLFGDFASALLLRWQGRLLHCIDPYIIDVNNASLYGYQPSKFGENKEVLALAHRALDSYQDRVRFYIATSEEIAPKFSDSTVDFAYIDGNHRAPFPAQDIALWWPKVRPGGILAGHDIWHQDMPDFPWEQFIRPAVETFASKRGLTVQVIEQVNPGREYEFIGSAWSWYIEKPKETTVGPL